MTNFTESESKKYTVFFEGECVLEAKDKKDAEEQFNDFLRVFNERDGKPSSIEKLSCVVYSAGETVEDV